MVERLDKVVLADRKSKSLEETKQYLPHDDNHLLLFQTSQSQLIEQRSNPDSTQATSYGSSEFAREFSQLTEYDKKRHDGVKAYVEALRRMEDKQIIKPCGKIFLG
jgi:hypothetical protein